MFGHSLFVNHFVFDERNWSHSQNLQEFIKRIFGTCHRPSFPFSKCSLPKSMRLPKMCCNNDVVNIFSIFGKHLKAKNKQPFGPRYINSSSRFWNLYSSRCFLFEKSARESASLGAAWHWNGLTGHFFKQWPQPFVCKTFVRIDPQLAPQIEEIQ